MAKVTPASWAQSLLLSLETPLTEANLRIIIGWESAEGGAGPQFGIPKNIADFNPLNTTQPMHSPDSRNTPGNNPPVQAYNSWSQGLQATVITLNNGFYTAILDLLNRGDATPAQAVNAVNGSQWGTHDLTASLILNAAVGLTVPNVPNSAGLTIPAVKAGGAAGLGGTGVPANGTQISPWIVGDSTNPDQDYWTTINQYGQEAQWYVFSDGETLYVADAIRLMAQTPALVISIDDPRVLDFNLTYDNTSFEYAVTRKAKVGVQRRATLSRTTSPTQLSLKIICDIDDYRGGDVIYVLGLGPGDGLWLVGDCPRSVFDPYSTLNLVKGAMPLSGETGETIGPSLSPAKTASKPGSGTVIAAMLSEANALNKDNIPYVWGGGHERAGSISIGTSGGNGYNGTRKGFDCSGAVGAVLAAAGVGITWGSSFGNDYAVIQTLQKAGVLLPGEGSGPVECTIYDNPNMHIYMRLNGSYWGTAAGGHLPSNGYGVGWVQDGGPEEGFTAYHIRPDLLRVHITGSNTQNAAAA